MPRRSSKLAGLLLAGLLLAGAGWLASRPAPAPQRPIALFTSLPILWHETGELGDLLNEDAQPHWAKSLIEARGRIVPLDLLSALTPGLTRLVIAQPRPLSPPENVALDDWVRGGGHLVLFADPALTEHSAFALGDPRRPQDLVLLSPILARWGLELTFDERAPPGLRAVDAGVAQIPVDLPGGWRLTGGTDCSLLGGGLVADCRIGQGRVLAIADAALLDRRDGNSVHAAALASLLDRAFTAR